LLEFGVASEEDVEFFSEQLQEFLESVISREYFGETEKRRFGPILFVGVLKHPLDGKCSLFLQTINEHAETLFCALDEFSNKCSMFIEYERKDSRGSVRA
jgi:hypothetical protein